MEEQGGGGAVALVADEGAVRVSGSYGTKLEAVVRRILHITRGDPTSKVSRLPPGLSFRHFVHHPPGPHLKGEPVTSSFTYVSSYTSPVGTPPPR